jgi:hypothetical protein
VGLQLATVCVPRICNIAKHEHHDACTVSPSLRKRRSAKEIIHDIARTLATQNAGPTCSIFWSPLRHGKSNPGSDTDLL